MLNGQSWHDFLHKFESISLTLEQSPRAAHKLQFNCESWHDAKFLHKLQLDGQVIGTGTNPKLYLKSQYPRRNQVEHSKKLESGATHRLFVSRISQNCPKKFAGHLQNSLTRPKNVSSLKQVPPFWHTLLLTQPFGPNFMLQYCPVKPGRHVQTGSLFELTVHVAPFLHGPKKQGLTFQPKIKLLNFKIISNLFHKIVHFCQADIRRCTEKIKSCKYIYHHFDRDSSLEAHKMFQCNQLNLILSLQN